MNNIDFISLYHSYINNFLPNIILTKKIKYLDKKNIVDKYFDSPFISQQLKEKLNEKIKDVKIYDYIFVLDLPQGMINFHFISDKGLKSINKLKKYYFYLIYLQIHSGKKSLYLNDIYIYLITVKVPKKISVPITINDINSACTAIHHPRFGGPIFIWRSDEIEKVLVHETLHSLLYDWDIIEQKLKPELKKLEEKIDKNGKGLNINEAYTELCATFIMCLFKIGQKMNKQEAKKVLRSQLKKVLEHSLKTCGNLFKKYNIEYANSCTIVSNIDNCGYHQQASAFSYIIIKTALLWTLMKTCKLKNKKSTDKIQCIEDFLSIGFTGKIGESYQDLVIKILGNKKFNEIINKYIKIKGRHGNLYFTIFH